MKRKKEEEKHNLECFIDVYKEQVDSNASFRILETEEAKSIFPKYNEENPDFVVQLKGKYIAMELFTLVENKTKRFNVDFTGINAKNLAELNAKQEKLNDYSLLENDDLFGAVLDRLKEKYKKINNYINCPIWFIGHVPRLYNIGLLSSVFDDKEKDLASSIYKSLPKDDRVDKIWLVEFGSKSFLLEVKE